MRIHKHINFFKVVEHFQNLLHDSGVRIKNDGFPDLTDFDYPKSIPPDVEMWPYSKRNQAQKPRNTIITFFETDPILYADLNTIDKVICNLALYRYTTGFDISPCLDFNIEAQKAALVINALTNGIMLSHGIAVIPTLRTGSIETTSYLNCYPKHICYAFGALGCNQRYASYGQLLTATKLALCEPTQVISYGKMSACDRELFYGWGVPVLNIPDYQTRCRKKAAERK